jgi:hypothetical protein
MPTTTITTTVTEPDGTTMTTTTTTTTEVAPPPTVDTPAPPAAAAAAAALAFPTTPEDITLSFLSKVLGAEGEGLRGFEYAELGEPGFLADVWGLTLKFKGDKPTKKLVIKVNTQVEERLGLAKMGMAYLKEYSMFNELLKDMPVDCVQCLYCGLTEDETGFLLVMEDLNARSDHLDQLKGINFDQECKMAVDLGKIHAKFWNDETTLSKPYLAPEGYLETPPLIVAWAAGFEPLWPEFKKNWQSALTDKGYDRAGLDKFPAADAFFCKVAEDPTKVCAGLVEYWRAKSYRTLCHGDTRSDNLFQKPDGGLVWIDWQLVFTGSSVGMDLGWGVWGCCDADVRRREKEIIHAYYESLCAACPEAAKALSEDDVYEDYCHGLVLWSMAMIGACAPILQGEMKERDLKLFNDAFPRFWISIEELGCLEIVEKLLAAA